MIESQVVIKNLSPVPVGSANQCTEPVRRIIAHTHHEQELSASPHVGRVWDAESGVVIDASVLEAILGSAPKVVVGCKPHISFLHSTHKRPATALKIVVASQSWQERPQSLHKGS